MGNKCDSDTRAVSPEEGETLASEFGLKYFETSALNNTNIEESFSYLAQEILKVKDFKDVNIGEKKVQIEQPNKVNNKSKKGCC